MRCGCTMRTDGWWVDERGGALVRSCGVHVRAWLLALRPKLWLSAALAANTTPSPPGPPHLGALRGARALVSVMLHHIHAAVAVKVGGAALVAGACVRACAYARRLSATSAPCPPGELMARLQRAQTPPRAPASSPWSLRPRWSAARPPPEMYSSLVSTGLLHSPQASSPGFPGGCAGATAPMAGCQQVKCRVSSDR